MRYAFNSTYFAHCLKAYIGGQRLRDVAEDVHVDASTLCRITNGASPNIRTFAMLCGHMRIDPKDFFFDEDIEYDE